MFQGPPNPGFRSAKRRKLRFSQKGLTRFQKFFSIWVPVNTLHDWRAKLERAYSLMVYYCKNTECCIKVAPCISKSTQYCKGGLPFEL